jgi:hypothetical protein
MKNYQDLLFPAVGMGAFPQPEISMEIYHSAFYHKMIAPFFNFKIF